MTDPLVMAAAAVREAAKTAKRSSAQSRRQARHLMSVLAALEAECEKRGIKLIESGDSRHG